VRTETVVQRPQRVRVAALPVIASLVRRATFLRGAGLRGVGTSREDVEDLWITRNLEYPR
jgi:hypothetical protein